MKKLLSFLLSLCLICTLIGSLIVPAHADGSIYISISSSASSVKRGETVTFTVSVSGSAAVTQYGLKLSYDSSVFEMVGGECTADAWYPDFTPDRGFAVMYKEATIPSGRVGTFTLRAKDDASFTDSWVGGTAAAMNGADSVSSSAGGTSVTIVCSHSYGNWTKVDGDTHSRTCTACGESQSASHNWDGGKTTKPADCQTTGELLRTCTDCGATKTETIPLGEHKYSSWSRVDDSKHTHTCSVCGKEETAGHSWNGGTTIKAATCQSTGEVRYTCTGCKTTRTETTARLSTHTYDHGCDTDCNVCGATRTTSHNFSTEWKNDKSGHWHECTECGEKEASAAHVPGPEPTDTTDQVCTVCAYVIKPSLSHEHVYADKLTGDETGHWYPCNQCDDQKDLAPHDFDNDCDEICDTCQFRRTIEHKWSEAWESDAASHYRACTVCGEKQDTAAHDWRRGECRVCQAVDPNYVPFTMPFWGWLLIGFAAGCAVTSILFLLLGKRRKEDEPDEPADHKDPPHDDPPTPGKATPTVTAPTQATPVIKPTPIAATPVKPAAAKPSPAKPAPASDDGVQVEVVSAESLRAASAASAEPEKQPVVVPSVQEVAPKKKPTAPKTPVSDVESEVQILSDWKPFR